MTVQETYELGKAYLEGKEGLAQDEAKGWACIKQAAEAGFENAVYEYAKKVAESDPQWVLGAIAPLLEGDENGYKTLSLYLPALAKCAENAPENAKEYLAEAEKWGYKVQPRWTVVNTALAKLLLIAAPERGEDIKRYYYFATIGNGSENGVLAWEPAYAKYGIVKNVADLKSMREYTSALREWERRKEETRKPGDYNLKITKDFVKINKSVEFIKEIFRQRFAGEKKSDASALTETQWAALKTAAIPEPELVYEKVCGKVKNLGECSYSCKHDDPLNIIKTDAKGTLYIDKSYGVYEACYVADGSEKGLTAEINDYEYDEVNIPENAVFRAGVQGNNESLDARLYDTLYKAIRLNVKEYLYEQKGWLSDHITFYGENTHGRDETWGEVYVPYYYFVYDVNGTKVTVRVNANNGTVRYFVDNEYGQLPKYNTTEKAPKGSQPKEKKPWLIPVIIAGVLGGLLILGVLGLAVVGAAMSV